MPATRKSRYEFAPVEVDAAGRTFLDVPYPAPKSVLLRGAKRVAVGETDTLWVLAWDAYQSLLDREQDFRPSSLFDVVANANDVVDPLAPFAPGTTFYVPTIEVVLGDVRVPPSFSATNRVNA